MTTTIRQDLAAYHATEAALAGRMEEVSVSLGNHSSGLWQEIRIEDNDTGASVAFPVQSLEGMTDAGKLLFLQAQEDLLRDLAELARERAAFDGGLTP